MIVLALCRLHGGLRQLRYAAVSRVGLSFFLAGIAINSREEHYAKAEVVVAAAGAIAVPISHTAVSRVVVPTAATFHAVRAR